VTRRQDLTEVTPTPAKAAVSETREIVATVPLRRTSERPIADPWRDVLLTLALELPLESSPIELSERFLDSVFRMLPHLALGASLVLEPGERPTVMVRIPVNHKGAMQRDPSRLFPLLHDERIFPLDEASTFHVAASSDLSPLDLQIAERAATVLSRSLDRSRTYRRAHASARNLERLQAHMIQAEKLASLGQIVAGVVHELNNPLTSIIAYAEYLSRKARPRLPDGDAADEIERLRRIEEAAGRILRFSRDLVAYARPSNEVPGPVHLKDVVEKALVFCEHEFSGISIELDLPPALPAILGVGGSLTQVFVNLFTNAAHSMAGRGGHLRLKAEVSIDARAIVFEIEDEGVGIPPESLPMIFEPFYTTKSEGRGSGLGLSIVKGILDSLGGNIRVASTPGQGTTFSLSLPIAATGSIFPAR
jgi:two-component system NtrC family sensor kinase